jgi:pectate lyase
VHVYQKGVLDSDSDNDTQNAAARSGYRHSRFDNVQSPLPLQRRGLSHIYDNDFGNMLTCGSNLRMGRWR